MAFSNKAGASQDAFLLWFVQAAAKNNSELF